MIKNIIKNFKIIKIILILIFLINFIKCQDININTNNTNTNTTTNNNNNNTIIINNGPLCPSKPLCPCICEECGPPIGRKNSKQIFIYVAGGKQSNYTYFEKDPSVKWEEIDTLALYSNKFDKRITCLAHRNNVKVVFTIEEGNVFDDFKYLKVNGNYWDGYINTSRLVNTLLENNVDGYSLDFEYGNRHGKDLEFSNTLKTIYTKLKSVNENYQLTSAFSGYYSDVLRKQIQLVADNLDYIIIMGYDFINTKIGTNITNSANSPIGLRKIVKSWWMDPLEKKDSAKIVLAVPWYGQIAKCDLTYEQRANPATIFQADCIIDNRTNVVQKPIREILALLNNDYLIFDINSNNENIINNKIINNTIKYSSGILWTSNTQTVFSRYRDTNGDIYQFNYDSPFSIYSKLRSLGIGGSGVWCLDKIIGLPKPIIDAFYFAFSRQVIGDTYIEIN
ncbi:hypothetical protein ACTFIW_005907 [Dictyostelium discoideum]